MRNLFLALGLLILIISAVKAGNNPTYEVQPGDTLYDIAKAHGISWEELAELNKIKDPKKMWAGTILRLPAETTPLLMRSDGTFYEVTAKEKELLARLVYAEAAGESLEGKIAVAAVVLNRVRSPVFPDTVTDVIFQPGQFTPIENNLLPAQTNDDCMQAVRRALSGEDPSRGALFFYNPATSDYLDYWETKKVIKRIGNHNFAL
ncbi:MAG TPA: LysM peptidoglycan-binding domain-containing protein [Firmicutes bacterium]|nr:LysM peptidoglycan-binding domain-containing protein [Bacillota bacterium]